MISEGMTNNRFENLIVSRLEGIPILSTYARTRGWSFIIAWCHRIAGLLLVAFLWFHILTLSSLHSPTLYDAKMKILEFFVFKIFEWALAIPVIFHALNGGRLILYESFGIRNDESMIRWVFWLSLIYVAFLGIWMWAGNQRASAVFFLLSTFVTGLILCYEVSLKVWKSRHSTFWKLQRITGAFLVIMIPAHLLFMHLSPSIGHSSEIVIMRMQNVLIKVIDLALAVGVIYHGAFGVISIMGDYIGSRFLRMGLTAVVVVVMAVFAFIGIRLIILI